VTSNLAQCPVWIRQPSVWFFMLTSCGFRVYSGETLSRIPSHVPSLYHAAINAHAAGVRGICGRIGKALSRFALIS
jgi:hypothetical protein